MARWIRGLIVAVVATTVGALVAAPLAYAAVAQTITFNAPTSLTLAQSPYTLSATASSGLPVTFTTSTAAVCTVSGNQLTLLARGTCKVTATQAGNATYKPASVTKSINITKASQSITFNAPASLTLAQSPYLMTATASSGLTVSYTSSTTTTCTVSGATLTLKTTGTCTLTASQSGNGIYNAATSVSRSISLIKASQSITLNVASSALMTDSPLKVTATATSGLTVTTSVTTPSVCSLTGATLTLLAAGTCTVSASQAGDAIYLAAPSTSTNIAVSRAPQVVTFNPPVSVLTTDAPLSLTATATSGLPITYSNGSPLVCSLSGQTVSWLTSGSCTITASQAGNAVYAPASSTQTITVNPAPDTLTFTLPAEASITAGMLALSASASSGRPVSYGSTTPTVCAIGQKSVTLIAGGTCTITASVPTDPRYVTPDPVTRSMTIVKAPQVIEIGAPAFLDAASAPRPIAGKATSGLPVTISSRTSDVCSVADGTLTVHKAGTCTLVGVQAGDSYWAAATESLDFDVLFVPQSLDFTLPTVSPWINGPIALSATATSGLSVLYSVGSLAVCHVDLATGTLVPDAAGDCTVTAVQPGDDIYLPAAPITRTVTIVLLEQTVTIQAPSTASMLDSPLAGITARSSAGLPVVMASVTPGVCAWDTTNGTLLIGANGTCTLRASQLDNQYYETASATASITVVPESPDVSLSLSQGTVKKTLPVTATVKVTRPLRPQDAIADAVVSFAYDGPAGRTALGTARTDTNGVATATIAFPDAGSYSVVASVLGNGETLLSSAEQSSFVVVTSDTPSVSLAIAPLSHRTPPFPTEWPGGEVAMFAAQVTGPDGSPEADALVKFWAYSITAPGVEFGIGEATTGADGTAFVLYGFDQVGSYKIVATVSPYGTFAVAQSDPTTITITTPVVATATTVMATPAAVSPDEEFALLAQVLDSTGAATNGQPVEFVARPVGVDRWTTVGSATTAGSTSPWIITRTFLPSTGTWEVAAHALPMNELAESWSAPIVMSVSELPPGRTPTTTTLVNSTVATQIGTVPSEISLTARVSSIGSGSTQGMVLRLYGRYVGAADWILVSEQRADAAGTTIFTVPIPSPGKYEVYARAIGTESFAGSSSSTLTATDSLTALAFEGPYPEIHVLEGEQFRVTAPRVLGTVSSVSFGVSPPLPNDLTLDPNTGDIYGRALTSLPPTVFTVTAFEAQTGRSVVTSALIDIAAANPLTVDYPDGTATVGESTYFSPVVRGGLAPYNFAVLSGNLPSGLSLNTSTGVVSGTPLVANDSLVTMVVFDAGRRSASTSVRFSVTSGVPGVPEKLTVESAKSALGISWSPPLTGAPPTAYRVDIGTAANGPWTSIQTAGLAYTATGLASGSTYFVRVAATNANGVGPSTIPVSGVAGGAPSQPSNVAAVIGRDSALLSWSAPVSDGGSAITNYVTQWGTSPSGPWQGSVSTFAPTTTSNVTGLVPGTTYYFVVNAANVWGSGPNSTPLAARTALASPPSAVVNLTAAVASGSSIRVSWGAPASDGGSPLTGYELTWGTSPSGVGLGTVAMPTSSTSWTASGLNAQTTYYFAVRAMNSLGSGPSSVVSATTAAVSTPGPVQGLLVSRAGGGVKLNWQPPVDSGGGPVTGYEVSWGTSPGSWTARAMVTAAPYTISGLTRGAVYYFQVRATNSAGLGIPSVVSFLV